METSLRVAHEVDHLVRPLDARLTLLLGVVETLLLKALLLLPDADLRLRVVEAKAAQLLREIARARRHIEALLRSSVGKAARRRREVAVLPHSRVGEAALRLADVGEACLIAVKLVVEVVVVVRRRRHRVAVGRVAEVADRAPQHVVVVLATKLPARRDELVHHTGKRLLHQVLCGKLIAITNGTRKIRVGVLACGTRPRLARGLQPRLRRLIAAGLVVGSTQRRRSGAPRIRRLARHREPRHRSVLRGHVVRRVAHNASPTLLHGLRSRSKTVLRRGSRLERLRAEVLRRREDVVDVGVVLRRVVGRRLRVCGRIIVSAAAAAEESAQEAH